MFKKPLYFTVFCDPWLFKIAYKIQLKSIKIVSKTILYLAYGFTSIFEGFWIPSWPQIGGPGGHFGPQNRPKWDDTDKQSLFFCHRGPNL